MVVKEERKLSELLTILLNSRDVFFSGLCGIILTLVGRNKISYYESVELRRFITENRPIKKWYSIFTNSNNYDYYWKVGIWFPRKVWLKKHIKSLKKQGL